jgi:cyclophilin family peptidyl-prolyl cis-trans isomerase
MRTLTALALTALAAQTALAQLTPDRTYYGVDRAIPMQVVVPSGVSGDAKVNIYAWGSNEPAMTAPVVAGGVNLAALFADLWGKKSTVVHYAQLVVGDKKVGAPVVLQPLTDAMPAQMDRNTGRPAFAPKRGMVSGIRAYVEKYAVLETTFGAITIRYRPDQAPNTCWNSMQLISGGLYEDVAFHRILGPQQGKPGFMAQCGDPTGTGVGGPGYCVDLEDSKLPHDFGVLSMARSGDPNSNGSQFFLCFSREGTSFLDGLYCAFAQTIDGAEVLQKLQEVETVIMPGSNPPEKSKPVNAPKLITAKLVDAAPYGEGRTPVLAPGTTVAPR